MLFTDEPSIDLGKAFSRSGKCRRYMKYIQTKPAPLHFAQGGDTDLELVDSMNAFMAKIIVSLHSNMFEIIVYWTGISSIAIENISPKSSSGTSQVSIIFSMYQFIMRFEEF